MNCNNPIKHRVKDKETLFLLARYYKISVPDILSMNYGLDPYNLQVGSFITICPGADFKPVDNEPCDTSAQTLLINDMRLIWSQHIYWTYAAIISITEKLKDTDDTLHRLLKNPDDLFNLYVKYYPRPQCMTIRNLLAEHLEVGGQIISAARGNQAYAANQLNVKWYKNADRLSIAFADICPYYQREEVQKMFYKHLAYLTDMLMDRLKQDYGSAISVFNKSEKEMMMMADYFSCGIIKQFPRQFEYAH